jgi:dTDP-4-amino-4,6-dideoxygalactose transaminase
MTRVPFLELLPTYLELKDQIDNRVSEALASGWYIGGKLVTAFEEEYAHYCNVESCVSVGNGLDALRIALMCYGIKSGDKVLVPSHTFIATWLAVSALGAIPVPVEPSNGRRIIDQYDFMEHLTDDIKAVVPVLLYGETTDYSLLIDLCNQLGKTVVIDAAQAHGARVSPDVMLNRCTHCWSFYPGKNLGAFGDAGAMTFVDSKASNMARMIANYGSEHKYVHDYAGVNSRMDPIQAAVLSEKLKCLDEWNIRRQSIAQKYSSQIMTVSVPNPPSCEYSHVWHLYVIETERRSELVKHLSAHGVGSQIHYPIPVHMQGAYSDYSTMELPTSKALADTVLSLPIGPHLSTQQVDYVIDVVNSFK